MTRQRLVRIVMAIGLPVVALVFVGTIGCGAPKPPPPPLTLPVDAYVRAVIPLDVQTDADVWIRPISARLPRRDRLVIDVALVGHVDGVWDAGDIMQLSCHYDPAKFVEVRDQEGRTVQFKPVKRMSRTRCTGCHSVRSTREYRFPWDGDRWSTVARLHCRLRGKPLKLGESIDVRLLPLDWHEEGLSWRGRDTLTVDVDYDWHRLDLHQGGFLWPTSGRYGR